MSSPQDRPTFRALVTGANSGLGFAICARLADEFLATRPSSHHLYLIPTTRSASKASDAVARLKSRIAKSHGEPAASRITIEPLLLDLTSLLSIQRASRELLGRIPRLDAAVLNAGIGGWIGIDWGAVAKQLVSDPLGIVTRPAFKKTAVGWTTKPQLPADAPSSLGEQEPALGEVFCANTFGHYMLAHYVSPLLAGGHGVAPGRVIWVSTLEAHAHTFVPDTDFQGVANYWSYESSKRLADLLVLTSDLKATEPWVDSYFVDTDPSHPKRPSSSRTQKAENIDEPASSRSSTARPRMLIAHPGICKTSIMPVPAFIIIFYHLALYLARFLGSQWHTCTPYSAATAPVWLALADDTAIDGAEGGRKGKWGSAANRWGSERVSRTDVDGWDVGGRPGAGGESSLAFTTLGTECWRRMEELRVEWERRLQGLMV
ncbi:hypothetical protein EJ06DRAFT_525738 [Trichodelitschia bisporula]|uniref:3-keto-steroid reductase n=1 Tax=Trichodelitschia bisporula TaxID=703511 RepID=A0A6G1IAA4_9PEZI|nr:hypothetical protein EJ06DRAFT_525738 [Trichodelitschia bisporula]